MTMFTRVISSLPGCPENRTCYTIDMYQLPTFFSLPRTLNDDIRYLKVVVFTITTSNAASLIIVINN